jgi:ribosomal protein S18 acetylase RimI-like enzyme
MQRVYRRAASRTLRRAGVSADGRGERAPALPRASVVTATETVSFRAMNFTDFEPVHKLLMQSSGMAVRDADGPEGVARYLARNPELSLVALEHGNIVGFVFCGHDGRRGYLHHLAVASSHRGRGIGKALVTRCITALAEQGIAKIHADVLQQNPEAMDFWRRMGFGQRDDIARFSYAPPSQPDA